MLSSADYDLVRRDPDVPGLAVVLDPDAFFAALRLVPMSLRPSPAGLNAVSIGVENGESVFSRRKGR